MESSKRKATGNAYSVANNEEKRPFPVRKRASDRISNCLFHKSGNHYFINKL